MIQAVWNITKQIDKNGMGESFRKGWGGEQWEVREGLMAEVLLSSGVEGQESGSYVQVWAFTATEQQEAQMPCIQRARPVGGMGTERLYCFPRMLP